MRAETELFKDKIEVSLDGRQVFYLFFGGAVIASLVFVLGVMVGKRVEARAHVDDRPISEARDPLAALDRLGQRDELAFPSALVGAGDVPLGEIDQALAASMARRDRRAEAAPTKVKKPEAEAKKPEARKPEARKPEAKKAEAKKPEAKKPEARKPEAEAKKAEAKKPEARKPEARKPEAEAKKAEARKPEARASGTHEGDEARADSARESRFTLQLSSFGDRAEAESFRAKLIKAGYSAYIVEAEVPDKGTWYRVRLGGYDSYDAAVTAKKEFEARQQIIAYVTRIKK
jgi:cell division protein FtsN